MLDMAFQENLLHGRRDPTEKLLYSTLTVYRLIATTLASIVGRAGLVLNIEL
jgi:hypothetical protein